jgi:hypothetical protein
LMFVFMVLDRFHQYYFHRFDTRDPFFHWLLRGDGYSEHSLSIYFSVTLIDNVAAATVQDFSAVADVRSSISPTMLVFSSMYFFLCPAFFFKRTCNASSRLR